MNAWLPKNSNLTQAKIFLLRKNISFGLGLNFWLVRPSGKTCQDTISVWTLKYLHKHPGPPFQIREGPGSFSRFHCYYLNIQVLLWCEKEDQFALVGITVKNLQEIGTWGGKNWKKKLFEIFFFKVRKKMFKILGAKNRRKNLHKHPGPPFQIRGGPGSFSNALIWSTNV